MFAVPGWAVSADSLVSQQVHQNSSRESRSTSGGSSALPSQSKKRKRDDTEDKGNLKVTSEDLDQLWNKQFSDNTKGKNGSTTAQAAKKERKEKSRLKKRMKKNTGQENGAENSPRTQTSSTSSSSAIVQPKKVKQKKTWEAPNNETYTSRRLGGIAEPVEGAEIKRKLAIQTSATKEEMPQSSRSKHISKLPPPACPLPPQQVQSTTAKVLTPLQAKMRNKLTSARFRHLNETLYTSKSSTALDLFTSSPSLFAEYHAGFSQQVRDSWPDNPVDGYIGDIKNRGKISEGHGRGDSGRGILPLPRRKTGSCTIADLGCGDAPLARGSQAQTKALRLQFHNFDLFSANNHVTKADISDLPLRDGEVDIAVFCLSLMGTNWIDFVEEAWRILRGDGKGEIWVAEVKSRFGRVARKVVENSVGKKRKTKKPLKATDVEDELVNGEELFAEDDRNAEEVADETDISGFVKVFQRRGFALREDSVIKRNKMFVSMIFTKTGVPTAGKFKGMKWNGREYERLRGPANGRMKFLDAGEEEEVVPEEESKVLKPCVYKTR